MKTEVSIDENNVISVGRQKYVGSELDLDDILSDFKRYNKKSFFYPDGTTKEIYCNTYGFKVCGLPRSHSFEKRSSVPLKNIDFSCPFPRFVDVPLKSNYEKEKENRKRAVRRIEDIIKLNTELSNFVTLTFDPEIVESSDPKEVYKVFEQWLKNAVSRKGLKYVFVPEYHKKDGKIHFHGIVNDVLSCVDSGTRKVNGFYKPVRISKIDRWISSARIAPEDVREIVYNLPDWKYGFSTSMKIEKSQGNVLNYITKYITKDAQGNNKIFGKRYWTSRNLEVYPVIELENVPRSVYSELDVKEYSNEYDGRKYKYINKKENT